jgi:hypothetical protein
MKHLPSAKSNNFGNLLQNQSPYFTTKGDVTETHQRNPSMNLIQQAMIKMGAKGPEIECAHGVVNSETDLTAAPRPEFFGTRSSRITILSYIDAGNGEPVTVKFPTEQSYSNGRHELGAR